MASFSRMDFEHGFSVDPSAVRETAKRQWIFSTVILAVALMVVASIGIRAALEPGAATVQQQTKSHLANVATPERVTVRYVYRSNPDHRLALVSATRID
jgi:hypothetical protein